MLGGVRAPAAGSARHGGYSELDNLLHGRDSGSTQPPAPRASAQDAAGMSSAAIERAERNGEFLRPGQRERAFAWVRDSATDAIYQTTGQGARVTSPRRPDSGAAGVTSAQRILQAVRRGDLGVGEMPERDNSWVRTGEGGEEGGKVAHLEPRTMAEGVAGRSSKQIGGDARRRHDGASSPIFGRAVDVPSMRESETGVAGMASRQAGRERRRKQLSHAETGAESAGAIMFGSRVSPRGRQSPGWASRARRACAEPAGRLSGAADTTTGRLGALALSDPDRSQNRVLLHTRASA
ncbi:hypothetical protein T492DRAFT_886577 [Pavlovales sp. CCMP2436]|nr:hypothetical protein T492DRAFT_886577 [Pavlovales sp. CCMP2436]